ncbi:unnamed protein product [Fraxinus pennsylvanica]|uniref:Transcription factor CBF/NF-Y/archaeal histone domain-containing protein n=1 Tax=Fraxinus pennsylvanica TaxID=56036 RepID=A0AAD2DZ01_9LAMI|nr:unnamed protein product [Fraxinus pennsylvanica]
MVEEQDKLLPIANVGRIMRYILPRHAKISKEAKETMQECVTEFISFVTSEASDKCHKENRKTVNGEDICWALNSLGFDNFSEVMLRYLHKFREFERQKSEQNKASSTEEKDEVTSYELGLQPDTFAPLKFQILDKGESSSANPSFEDRGLQYLFLIYESMIDGYSIDKIGVQDHLCKPINYSSAILCITVSSRNSDPFFSEKYRTWL